MIDVPSTLSDAWRVIRGDDEMLSASENITPISTEAIYQQELASKNPAPGQWIEGEGVYVGQWKLGGALGKVFNIYAAPENLTDKTGQKAQFTYKEALSAIENTVSFHGYNGEYYSCDEALKNALLKGYYVGGWVIPPLEILRGVDIEKNDIQQDNIYAHRFEGELGKTLDVETIGTGKECPCWYWALTQRAGWPLMVLFNNGDVESITPNRLKLSLRPVRFVEVK